MGIPDLTSATVKCSAIFLACWNDGYYVVHRGKRGNIYFLLVDVVFVWQVAMLRNEMMKSRLINNGSWEAHSCLRDTSAVSAHENFIKCLLWSKYWFFQKLGVKWQLLKFRDYAHTALKTTIWVWDPIPVCWCLYVYGYFCFWVLTYIFLAFK